MNINDMKLRQVHLLRSNGIFHLEKGDSLLYKQIYMRIFLKMTPPVLFSQQLSLVYRLSCPGAGIIFATEPRQPVVKPDFAFAKRMRSRAL